MESKKEKAFPRGGKKSAFFKSKKHSSSSLFRKTKTKVKKKNKKTTQAQKKSEALKPKVKKIEDRLEVRYVDDLNPSSVQEGMLVLGIVSQVSERALKVSLPGGLRGVVLLQNVSEFYTSLIKNISRQSEVHSLNEMFRVGDILPVKVLSVSEIKAALLVSIDPKVINQKLSYNSIEKGFILVGNVKSKEEHGFIIDLGLSQVNAFLHFNKVDPERPLLIGQVVRCCVIECNTSPGFSNVQLSTLKTDLKSSVINKKSVLPIYCFIPGFQFQISFKKKLAEGFEVSYGKGNLSKGYIHGDHLSNKFSDLSDDVLGSENIGTLLYIKPFVNFLYFKIMPKKELDWPFQYGEIVSGKVVRTKRSGVIFKVIRGSEKAKCFVPVSKLKNAHKILEEKIDITNLYPVGKKISKIRLGETNLMGRYYFGATDKASLEEKYFSVSDVKVGDIVSCQILSFGKSAARVRIGKTITGFVKFTQMSDVPLKNPNSKFRVGQKIKARVLETVPDTRFLRLTMKPSLMKEKEILCSYSDYNRNSCYLGTIFKVLQNKLIVLFFNHVTGVVPKSLTQYPDASSLSDHYQQGQLVKCWIVSREKNSKFNLSLVTGGANHQLEVGKKYKAVLVNKTKTGFLVDVLIDKDKKCKGYLPLETITVHHSLAAAYHSTYTSGERFWVRCLCKSTRDGMPLLGLSDFLEEFYEEQSKENLEKMLTIGSVLPFLYKLKNKKTNCIYLQSILPVEEDYLIKVSRDDFKDDLSASNRLKLSRYQLVYGKVMRIVKRKIFVSIRLRDVWDKDFNSSLDLLDSYLKAMNSLVDRQKTILESYKNDIHVGCSVNGVVEEVRSNCAVVRTESDDLGLAEGKFKQGEKVVGKVVWIDAFEQMIHFHVEADAVKENLSKDPITESECGNMRGRVVFISQEVVVVELKGRCKGELAFLPRRRHTNDFVVNESPFSVGEDLKIWAVRKSSKYLVGMDRRVVALHKALIWKKAEKKLKDSVQSLKRKLEEEKSERLKKRRTESESEDVEVVSMKVSKSKENASEEEKQKMTNGNSFCDDIEIKEEIESDDGVFNISNNSLPRLEYDDVDIKSEVEDDEKDEQILSAKINNNEKIILSSSSESEDEDETKESKNIDKNNAFKVGFNWEVLNNHNLLSGIVFNKNESSSDEEDDESKNEKKKKRKLTASEKREKAKSEEERLRLIEERLMDGDREPESADDFDRAVLSNPDSSALWLKYMAFHIQGTEIEKARAVAKRALKSISFRQEQEKLNIWIALLNLENLYGNEESLNKTLNEALQSNEPYKIHLHMLNIYGQGTKFQEMERLGNFIMKKYKDVENMWHDVGFAFFSVGKLESARNTLQKALTILDKSKHVPLISKFAQLENKFGSPERAQTLYESILSSFPKRVDIWSCYVDMLVKSNQIDLARQVLVLILW